MKNNKDKENNVVKLTQLAAMFGLDARIALAIFGALSIITGAALFSAISKSKSTAILTDLTELEKSIEQYILDTGKYLPMVATDVNSVNGAYLVKDKGVKGWSGPYIKYKTDTTNEMYFIPEKYPVMGIDVYKSDFLPTDDENASVCKKSSSSCYHWIFVYTDNIDVLKGIEKMIDSKNPEIGESSTSGRFLYHADGALYIGVYKTSIPYPPSYSKHS